MKKSKLDKSWKEGLKDRLRKRGESDSYLLGASDFQEKAIKALEKGSFSGDYPFLSKNVATQIIKELKA